MRHSLTRWKKHVLRIAAFPAQRASWDAMGTFSGGNDMRCFPWNSRWFWVALVLLSSSYYAGAQLPNCSQGCKEVAVWGFPGTNSLAYKYDQSNAIYPNSPEHPENWKSKEFFATKLIEKYDIETTSVKFKKASCPDVKATCSNKDANGNDVPQELTEVNCNQPLDTDKTLEKCKAKPSGGGA